MERDWILPFFLLLFLSASGCGRVTGTVSGRATTGIAENSELKLHTPTNAITINEGNAVAIIFTVSPSSHEEEYFTWMITDGGDDFVLSSGEITSPANEDYFFLTLRSRQDTNVEGSEAFQVSVGNSRLKINVILTLTITDDDIAGPTIASVSSSATNGAY